MMKKLDEKTYLFGVFDGHSGDQVSKYLSEHVAEAFENVESPNDEQLKGICHQLNQEIEDKKMVSGSTAVIALVRFQDKGGWDVIVMHVGDSRALVINAEGKLVHCTVDHTPVDPKEVQRIKESGGVIEDGRFLAYPKKETEKRQLSSLSMTRAFGNEKELKQKGLICDPTVTRLHCNVGDSICLFSDGLFEGLLRQKLDSNKQNSVLVSVLHQCWSDEKEDLARSCGELLEALTRSPKGSHTDDNLSLCIIRLQSMQVETEMNSFEVIPASIPSLVDENMDYALAYWKNLEKFRKESQTSRKRKLQEEEDSKVKIQHLQGEDKWCVAQNPPNYMHDVVLVVDEKNGDGMPLLVCSGAWQGKWTPHAVLCFLDQQWVPVNEDAKKKYSFFDCFGGIPKNLAPSPFPISTFHCRAQSKEEGLDHSLFKWEDGQIHYYKGYSSCQDPLGQFVDAKNFPQIQYVVYEHDWIIDRAHHNFTSSLPIIPGLTCQPAWTAVSGNYQYCIQLFRTEDKKFLLRRFSLHPYLVETQEVWCLKEKIDSIKTMQTNQTGDVVWIVASLLDASIFLYKYKC